jgi:hypothetical protein
MLALRRAGSADVEKGVVPVLRDGVLVATLWAARWKEAATAMVGHQEWIFARYAREGAAAELRTAGMATTAGVAAVGS